MLVEPEMSPCVSSLAETGESGSSDSLAAMGGYMLAEEPHCCGLVFDLPACGEAAVSQDPVLRHMCLHTEYLAVFTRTQQFIMRGDGPLPFEVRDYIALMAAGRHRSSALAEQLQDDFLANGGNPQWLEGLHNAPKKLRDLNEVNKILAHRPWLLSKSHIERLAKGRGNWSLGELIQALTILAHYHAVCSFVHGCRALSESVEPSSSPGSATPNGDGSDAKRDDPRPNGVPVNRLMKTMKSLSKQQSPGLDSPAAERTVSYDRVESDSAAERVTSLSQHLVADDATRQAVDGDFAYEANNVATFRVQDYSWEDHGFALVNRLYSDVGVLLDNKFRITYHLTYQTLGSFRAVDTSLFRRAIWRYIQSLYGIRHDDYDYSLVNQLLDHSLKSFIRCVCVSPEQLRPDALGRLLPGFQRSEKVHVTILCLEARLQSELLYALRAVMRHTT